MQFNIEKEDKAFLDSPDAGMLDCICSRCGKVIMGNEVPLRIWSKGTECNEEYEYRYCEKCQSSGGFTLTC